MVEKGTYTGEIGSFQKAEADERRLKLPVDSCGWRALLDGNSEDMLLLLDAVEIVLTEQLLAVQAGGECVIFDA
jgi:hypothetical protein